MAKLGKKSEIFKFRPREFTFVNAKNISPYITFLSLYITLIINNL